MTSLEALRRLDSGPRGLVEAEADERLARHGENTFPGRVPPSWARRWAHALRDPFTAVLLCLGLVSAAIGSWGTACVIGVLVVVSGVLRAGGEHRADRSMAALGALLPSTATVRRRAVEGAAPESREVPVDQLVPGDVVRLGPGDLVPADLRLLRATGLTVHQAALTGESTPVPKHPVEAPGELAGNAHDGGAGAAHGAGADGAAPCAEPQLCFQGSSVASGSGTGVVVATGGATRFAGAYRAPARHGLSAFDRSVNGVAWILIRFMLLTPPLVLMANAALRGRGLETLPFAVAVAVGLTPEMLPVVVTTALARGAAVLARGREVIVRRLPALHDLGAADVLCTDKTGTLTQGRPVLDCSLGADGAPDPGVARWAALNSFWTLHLAELPVPDALDEALLDAAAEADATHGADATGEPWDTDGPCGTAGASDTGTSGSTAERGGPGAPNEPRTPEGPAASGREDIWEWEGVAALPFDPVRRISCAVVRDPDGTGGDTVVVKGAAEDVLERCAMEEGARDVRLRRAESLAEDGLRVLAVATAERRARLGPYVPGDERGLTFRGLVGLRDAPAPTAAEALADLARQRVTVKVLTGDHPGTAARTCRDLGLLPGPEHTGLGTHGVGHSTAPRPEGGPGPGSAPAPEPGTEPGTEPKPGTEPEPRPGPGPDGAGHGATGVGHGAAGVVTGERIDTLDDAELAEVASRHTVFARCTPAQKARVVGALRAHGHTTGFLGDGVNDLAALHTADIGLAPRDAAPVAREAADVVLAAKDLTALGDAITTGRRSGGNIASYLRIVLSSNLGNVLAMLVAGLLLPFLPMFPAQVLVQNLCFDAAQLAFAFDRPCRSTLRVPTALRPRALLGFITGFGLLNAVADLATFAALGLAVHGVPGEGSQEVFHGGWFTENLLTQGMVMVLLRSGRSTALARTAGPLRVAVGGLAAVGLLLPLSPLGPPLGMTALPLAYYPMLALVLLLYGCALVAARTRYERRAMRRVRDHGESTGA